MYIAPHIMRSDSGQWAIVKKKNVCLLKYTEIAE